MTSDKIDALVERHLNSVYQFCCYLTGNRLDGEDLCQDTFLKAMEIERKLPVDASEREMRNYLIGIAVNLWKNHQRKKKRRQEIAPVQWEAYGELESIADELVVEEKILEQELEQLLQKAITGLPKKQKLVMDLYYSGQLSPQEIGKLLHIPKETVKSRLRLAKKKLRNELEVGGYER